MLELWFIRHGETDWNEGRRWQGQTDIPLNDNGMRQAACLARRFANMPFDGAYTSDLGRTRMTAEVVLPNLAATPDRRLREMSFGTFEGKSWHGMSVDEQQALNEWWKNPYKNRLPGGESFEELGQRLAEWRATLPASGRLAVFTHGGPIRSMLWEIVGPPKSREWTILLSNASLTRIAYEPGRATIITVNDCAHLEDAERLAAQPGLSSSKT